MRTGDVSSSHANSAPFAYLTSHRKQILIEFTTEMIKKKLDTSWISCYQAFAHLITLQSLELLLVAYFRNKNIYIYICIYLYHIHSYSIYMLEL